MDMEVKFIKLQAFKVSDKEVEIRTSEEFKNKISVFININYIVGIENYKIRTLRGILGTGEDYYYCVVEMINGKVYYLNDYNASKLIEFLQLANN